METNYIYNEEGEKLFLNGFEDYRKLPDMTPVLILKNNQYIREINKITFPFIKDDIVFEYQNESGAAYVLFVFMLQCFELLLDCENISHDERIRLVKIYEKLIPEILYEAKYGISHNKKPKKPKTYIEEVNTLPDFIRFLFFKAMSRVCDRYTGMASCLTYVERALLLPKYEGQFSKNDYASCISYVFLPLFGYYPESKKSLHL